MTRLLVDRLGEVASVGEELPQHIAARVPIGADPMEHAVLALGYIEISVLAGGVRVRLRPSRRHQEAIAGVLRELAILHPERIFLTHYDRGWKDEIVGSYADLIKRIQLLVFGERGKHPGARFHAEAVDLAAQMDRLHAPFRLLLDQWVDRDGILPVDLTEPFRRAMCRGRTTLLDVTREDRMVISHRGRQLTHYGRDGWRSLVGKLIEEQPDLRYATAASRAYLEVRNSGRPRVETCEAAIRGPHGLGRRSYYDRLLLPWRTETGRMMVSGVSVLRGRFDWTDPSQPDRSDTSSDDDIQTQETS